MDTIKKLLKERAVFLASCLLALLILFFLLGAVAKFIGACLVIDDPLQRSDCLIVLGGEKQERVKEAAELYFKGYSKRIILSGSEVVTGFTYAKLMSLQMQGLGVPRKALILEDKAETTYENAVFTKKIMQDMDFKSAIVVSSPYHMRRARFIFDRVYRGSGVKLTYHPAPDPDYLNGKWWGDEQKRKYVFAEYAKLLYYLKYLF